MKTGRSWSNAATSQGRLSPEAGRRRNGPLGPSEGAWPRQYLELGTPGPQNYDRINFCCFKPSSVFKYYDDSKNTINIVSISQKEN